MKVLIFGHICAVLSGLLCPVIVSAADSTLLKPAESLDKNQNKAPKSRIYTHPVRGFTIAVPPGADLLERDEKNPQISIRSRKGYRVSIQSGPVRPNVPLHEMLLRLEAKYLGQGKPWEHKVKQSQKQIAGLPAIEAYYDGANTRARVDIVRGLRTDFVFIFFAAEREYQNLEHEYEWVLSHFRPGPDDLPKLKVNPSSNFSVFAEPGYGYSIRYPLEWVHSKPSRMTAMFSGAEGSVAYSAIVSVQNISAPQANNSKAAAMVALSELKMSLKKSVQNLQYLDDKPWQYVRGPYHLNGRELVLSYKYAGQKFMKRIVVVPRPFQNLVHIWSYTAPVGIFESYREIANRMLQSWTILVSKDG